MFYPSGVPLLATYRAGMSSPEFLNLEEYSDQFLKQHVGVLLPYSKKWHPDPLHAWSRRWEYPWVSERLPKASPILDAGSGCTFFPSYLASRGYEVTCVDSDSTLAKPYSEMPGPVFKCASLDSIPAGDNAFEAIYCISVLEHLGERDKVIQEFYRVLRPGGSLLVTFDVSLRDDCHPISVKGARDLLEQIQEKFFPVSPVDLFQLSAPGILTTREGIEYDPILVPPSLRTESIDVDAVLAHRGWVTVVCAEFLRG